MTASTFSAYSRKPLCLLLALMTVLTLSISLYLQPLRCHTNGMSTNLYTAGTLLTVSSQNSAAFAPPSTSHASHIGTATTGDDDVQPTHLHPDSQTVAVYDHRGLRPGWCVIATAFMGRRDRSWLLMNYLQELMRRNLVDEIHLWDFTRNDKDRQWLHSYQLSLLATSTSFAYVHEMALDRYCASPFPRRLQFRISASSNVHLRLTLSSGEQYELVLGVSSNQASVFRKFNSAEPYWLYNLRMALPATEPYFTNVSLAHNGTHFLVQLQMPLDSPDLFQVSTTPNYSIADDRTWFIHHTDDRVLWTKVEFSTGFHSAGAWRMERLCDVVIAATQRIYIGYPKPSAMPGWSEYYRHYGHHRRHTYRDVVLLKMDDDIVYIDVDRFRDYINFRIDNPRYFLVFPSVINNGVAAYLQQDVQKVLPEVVGDFELPAGGAFGSLWQSPAKSLALHRYFLSDPHRFVHPNTTVCYPLVPSLRFSINFFAVLPEHLDYYLLVLRGADDEALLTVDISARYKLSKCVYPHFVVSHMAFAPQADQKKYPSARTWLRRTFERHSKTAITFISLAV